MVAIFLSWSPGEAHTEVHSLRALKLCGEVIFPLHKLAVKTWGKKTCGCLLLPPSLAHGAGAVRRLHSSSVTADGVRGSLQAGARARVRAPHVCREWVVALWSHMDA